MNCSNVIKRRDRFAVPRINWIHVSYNRVFMTGEGDGWLRSWWSVDSTPDKFGSGIHVDASHVYRNKERQK